MEIFTNNLTFVAMNTLLSTAYFPPISYFLALVQAENVYIEACEHFQKQTFRNRTYIQTSHGLQALTVPVIKTKGSHTPIKDILICNKTSWQALHYKAFCTAYNQSPFFLYYKDELRDLIFKPYATLWELNQSVLCFLMAKFKIKTLIGYTETYEKLLDNVIDYRESIHPKKQSPCAIPDYYHLFGDMQEQDLGNVSVLDFLFCEGPQFLGCKN